MRKFFELFHKHNDCLWNHGRLDKYGEQRTQEKNSSSSGKKKTEIASVTSVDRIQSISIEMYSERKWTQFIFDFCWSTLQLIRSFKLDSWERAALADIGLNDSRNKFFLTFANAVNGAIFFFFNALHTYKLPESSNISRISKSIWEKNPKRCVLRLSYVIYV